MKLLVALTSIPVMFKKLLHKYNQVRDISS